MVMRASCKKKGAWGRGDYRAKAKRPRSKELSNRNRGLETGSSGRRRSRTQDEAAKAGQMPERLEWWVENLELFSHRNGALLKILSKEG